MLCTGYGEAVPELLARARGADGYLEKPVEPVRLAAEIRTLIARAAMEREATHAGNER